eukprot:4800067-Amphidinium_carterae.1
MHTEVDSHHHQITPMIPLGLWSKWRSKSLSSSQGEIVLPCADWGTKMAKMTAAQPLDTHCKSLHTKPCLFGSSLDSELLKYSSSLPAPGVSGATYYNPRLEIPETLRTHLFS